METCFGTETAPPKRAGTTKFFSVEKNSRRIFGDGIWADRRKTHVLKGDSKNKKILPPFCALACRLLYPPAQSRF